MKKKIYRFIATCIAIYIGLALAAGVAFAVSFTFIGIIKGISLLVGLVC